MVEVRKLSEMMIVGLSTDSNSDLDMINNLWQSFGPLVGLIKNRPSKDFISMTIGNKVWAAVEVSDFENIPSKLEQYTIKEGLFVATMHKGPASTFNKTQMYILNQWLPESKFTLDSREHFEILPENYNPVDPNATEEVWIPIKEKN